MLLEFDEKKTIILRNLEDGQRCVLSSITIGKLHKCVINCIEIYREKDWLIFPIGTKEYKFLFSRVQQISTPSITLRLKGFENIRL